MPSSVESMPDADDPLGPRPPAKLDQALHQLEAGPAAVGAVHVADQPDTRAGRGLARREPLVEAGARCRPRSWPSARWRVGVKKLSR